MCRGSGLSQAGRYVPSRCSRQVRLKEYVPIGIKGIVGRACEIDAFGLEASRSYRLAGHAVSAKLLLATATSFRV